MRSQQQKLKLNELLNDLQLSARSHLNVEDDRFIVNVYDKINEVEESIKLLKKEMLKQDLDNS